MHQMTKNELVRQLVAQGEYKRALSICKEWTQEIPEDRNLLRLGYDCLVHPRFYKELGVDTDAAYNDAVAVLKRIYSKKDSSRDT